MNSKANLKSLNLKTRSNLGIPFSWVNNWEDDCPDGSDEQWYYQDDGGDDDEGPPTPEEAMYVTDTNGDDNMSLDEFVDFWNSDNPDAQIDSGYPVLTTSDVSDLIEMCDYDGNEMIDINEMQCFLSRIHI